MEEVSCVFLELYIYIYIYIYIYMKYRNIKRLYEMDRNNNITTECFSSYQPPSMCLIAFSASFGFSNSTYAKPRVNSGCTRSAGISMFLTTPYTEKISMMWSLLMFLVSRPMWTFDGFGVRLRFRRRGDHDLQERIYDSTVQFANMLNTMFYNCRYNIGNI